MSLTYTVLLGMTWSTSANVPTGVAYPSGGHYLYNGVVYSVLASGCTSPSYTFTYQHVWFDPINLSYITKQDHPLAVYKISGIAAPYSGTNCFFTFGGEWTDGMSITLYKSGYRYNPGGNSWQSLANIPTTYGSAGLALGYWRDTIYIIGGAVYNESVPYKNASNTLYKYSITNNSYTTGTNVPYNISEAAYATARNSAGDSSVFIFGGCQDYDDNWGTPSNFTTNTYEYRFSTGSWISRASLPGPARAGAVATVLRGKIYVIGGYTGSTDVNRVDIYNPSNNSWSTGPSLPSGHDGGAASAPDLPFNYSPTLLFPRDGDTICKDTTYGFDWDVVGPIKIVYNGEGTITGVTNFTYILRTDISNNILRYTQDPSFGTYNQVTTSSTNYNLALNQTGWWYWTVRSIDELGDSSLWSDTFSVYVRNCGLGEEELGPGKPLELRTRGVSLDVIELDLLCYEAKGLWLEVYNPLGVLVDRRNVPVRRGLNAILVPVPASGTYVVLLRDGERVLTKKVAIAK
ncbi:MAG: kelch repeat-containing protein [candidate division WOR-3 bacterium]